MKAQNSMKYIVSFLLILATGSYSKLKSEEIVNEQRLVDTQNVISSRPEEFEINYHRHNPTTLRGMDPIYQLTELLGISFGGKQGGKLIGFGYEERTLFWDAEAIENTYNKVLKQQYSENPINTKDINSIFDD